MLLMTQMKRDACTDHNKSAVNAQAVPISIKLRKIRPALRTIGVNHFQAVKSIAIPTSTNPTIHSAKMKHGQNPELKSVVSGTATKNYKTLHYPVNVVPEMGTEFPPVMKRN